MSIFSRATLRGYFETGKAPTQAHFTALIDSTNINSECVCVKSTSLTIATADVLTLNSAPIEIVAAPGAGYAIEVLSAVFSMTYNSIPYATNTVIQLKTTGSTKAQFQDNILKGDTTQYLNINLSSVGLISDTKILDNAGVDVTVNTGNPTAGDSDIKIYVTYRIIEL